MQAKSLQKAIDNLNELQPLVFEPQEVQLNPAASPEFYMERSDSPLEELKVYLLNSSGDQKILLTGHMGSGKSTELNRLAADPDLQDGFLIVKYGVRDVLNIIDITYTDFLLSFCAQLFIAAIDNEVAFQPSFLTQTTKWIGQATEVAGLEALSIKEGIPEKIRSFFEKVLSILLREMTLRNVLRQSIERNLNELINLLDAVIDQIQSALGTQRELLVIIDDLEKIPDVERSRKLFVEAGSFMNSPRCKIIYTLPSHLYYSVDIRQIVDSIGKVYFLGNIRLRDRQGQDDEAGFTYWRDKNVSSGICYIC